MTKRVSQRMRATLRAAWRWRAGYLYLLPTLLVVAVLIYLPMIEAIALSFQRALKFIDPAQYRFTGLSNYVAVATSPEFLKSLTLSLAFTGTTVVADTLLGLFAALLLWERFPLNNVVRSLVLIAYVLPANVTGVFWRFLLDNDIGLVNFLLVGLGLAEAPVSFFSREYAFLTIVLVQVWKDFAFSTIILLGALQQVPPDLYAMAAVDGAGRWGRFCYVTLPQIRHAIVLSLILRTTYNLAEFTLPWQLTAGGPGSATMLMPIYLWWKAFVDGDLGAGSAIGVYLLLLSALTAVLYLRLISRRQGGRA